MPCFKEQVHLESGHKSKFKFTNVQDYIHETRITHALLGLAESLSDQDEETMQAKLLVFEGHLIGLMANLVTAAPKDSPIPSGQISSFLEHPKLIHHILSDGICETRQTALLVFIHNAIIN